MPENETVTRRRRSSEERIARRKKNRRFGYVLLLFVLVIAGYFGGCYFFETHFLPGTKINNVDCSLESADSAFTKVSDALSGRTVTVKSEEADDVISSNDVGLYYENSEDLNDILMKQDANYWFLNLKKTYSYEAMKTSLDDDKLAKKIQTLACLTPSKPRESENPVLVYNKTTNEYDVKEGAVGNKVDQEALTKALKKAMLDGEEQVDLSASECYVPSAYNASSKEIVAAKKKADKYVATVVDYKSGDKELKVSGKQINKFVKISKDYKVTLDEDAIGSYVKKKIAKKFDTGSLSIIDSPGSGKIYVIPEEGDQAINRTTEKKHLIKAIKAGKQEERTPAYIEHYLYSSYGSAVKDSYVDVNLEDQKVYVIIDGEIQISSSCVSGNISTGHGSPTGIWRIAYKTTNYTMKKYRAHVNYWMPYDTTSGIGLHDATWRGEFGGNIYKYDGSHGCINLPLSKAASIYSIVYTGMPVVVHY